MQRLLLRVWKFLSAWPALERFLLLVVNSRFIVGVLGIVRDPEGRVLLLEHTYRRELPWGLPGGWLRRGESLGASLVREMREETGLEIRIDGLYRELSGFRQPRIEAVFLCSITGGSFRPSEEVSAHRFVSPGDPLPINPRHRDVVLSYFSARSPEAETEIR